MLIIGLLISTWGTAIVLVLYVLRKDILDAIQKLHVSPPKLEIGCEVELLIDQPTSLITTTTSLIPLEPIPKGRHGTVIQIHPDGLVMVWFNDGYGGTTNYVRPENLKVIS